MGDISGGLRRLAKAIEDGKVPGSVCRIDYGRDPTPAEKLRGFNFDGEKTIIIELHFAKGQDVLEQYVTRLLTSGAKPN